MPSSLKKIISIVIPCALSVGLLLWLFLTIDYKHMWQAIEGSDKRYMSAAALIFFFINFLMVWRWRILMKAVGLKAGVFACLRWFFVGLFCNLAPISTVGSDVIKGLGLAQETGYRPKVFASILLDRLSGFAGIVILAALAFVFGRGLIANKLVIAAIVIMSVISGGMVVVLFSHRIFSFTCKVFSVWPKITEALMRLHYDIVLLKGKQHKGWESIMISIGAQIILAIELYLSAKGLHQHISLVYFVIFSPIICVVTSLPSIGGLGFREIGWVYLLSLVGVSKEIAGGLSLVNSAFTIVVGLLGGLFYVTTLSARRVQYSQADAGFQGSAS